MFRYILLSALIFVFPDAGYTQDIVRSELLEEMSKQELTLLTGFPAVSGIKVYKVNYITTGSDMFPDTASGLVILPTGTRLPAIVAYQHGTTDGPEDVPSNLNGESFLVKAMAGQGYVVTAADYLGLGDSRGFHPYVHADTEASAGIDLLIAGKTLAASEGIDSLQFTFVTGYSQGGHAAMAMAKAIQERSTDDLWVTAAAPMSGPYDISGTMKMVTLTDTVEYFYPAYAVYIVLGYQEVYQNLYDSLDEVFHPVFIPMIKSFYEGSISLSDLNAFLISGLQEEFGKSVPRFLFQENYIQAILADTSHPAAVALRDNDVYEWVPEFPLRMFYCMKDDQVNFQNSLVAENFMNSNNAVDVDAVDVLPSGDHGECVLPASLATLFFFNSFINTTSVFDAEEIENIVVFPNPTNDYIYFKEFSSSNISDLGLYNSLGQQVIFLPEPGSSMVDVRHLQSGVYFLRMRASGRWVQSSFVKK